ncbi:MAG: hypothetical protein GY799_21410 [Desulfobulbaceae bacterium]|nr:hypothetical protein [Desulfobulbaceae bacterium]
MALETIALNTLSQRGTKTNYSLNSVSYSGEIDPDYPTKGSTRTIVSHTILSYGAAFTRKQKTFEVVEKGDVKLYIDPTGMTVVPSTKDTVTHITDGEFRVVDMITYNNVGQPILYILQLRQ